MNRRTIRVSDDQGKTRDNWRPIEDHIADQPEWSGFHVVHGATGEPVGRPRLPDAFLSPAGKRKREYRDHQKATLTPFEGRSSTAGDWRREAAERAEAIARVEEWKARRDK